MPRRTTKTRPTLAATIALLVTAALATACTGPSEPPTTPMTTAQVLALPTPRPSATPPATATTPTPAATWPPQMALPTPPPEMSRDDEAGAIAAAMYFLDLYAYTETTQDTTLWEAMSHPDCIFCQSVLDDVARQRAAGQLTLAAPMKVNSTSIKALNPLTFSVTVDLNTGPDEKFTLGGVSLERTAENSGLATIVVMYKGTTWVTRGVDLEKRS